MDRSEKMLRRLIESAKRSSPARTMAPSCRRGDPASLDGAFVSVLQRNDLSRTAGSAKKLTVENIHVLQCIACEA
jgi:hypothetical protein